MKTVKVYDFNTKTVSTIPQAELAPFMVLAKVDEIGECWVDQREVKRDATYRHAPLNTETMAVVENIRATLAEVYPKTLKEWEDGFRKDDDYKPEIAAWLRIAWVYATVTEGRNLSDSKRKAVFQTALKCSLATKEAVIETLGIGNKIPYVLQEVIDLFFDSSKP